MATVFVPTPLRRLMGGKRRVSIDAQTVDELIETLEANFPGVKTRLLDESGDVKRFINIFVDEEDFRTLQGGQTTLNTKSEVSIIPAMAGGC